MERLHPQSWKELRQLVKLHGSKALINAIILIEEQAKQEEKTNEHSHQISPRGHT
jgi:hypothetical protein